ncbi:YidE/YbjL duplication [Bradyrhizobium sp. BRP22]|uniref:aspartate:alanine exchanger family transporter n=1 Tax=Bradyrhizobium sp. BRP22 TaxID=2793821 RepID=UPI001CD23F29|nr:TrkA C-terminal domain-containing protein [Bradyrhizobium sp. BRP22]MCA1454663.1 YidE/YbjL duplication [Bradyrhizobium sp. BRP22]
MLDVAREIIGSQPILTAFLAIGLGYLVGQISIGGFSLGVGAVLFVGLAIGAFAPKAQIIGPIGLTGLIMFLYGIGILYGRQFFEGMVGVGQKYNLLALVACLAGLLVALGLGHIFGIKIGHTLGIYAGSMTSTATLQAALDVMKNKDPSIGYSIAYPFGVIGPILCIYFMTRVVKPKFPAKAQRFHMGEISVGEGFAGKRLSELMNEVLSDLQVTMIRKGERNIVPTPDTLLSAGDGVLVVAEREEAIARAAAQLGRLEPGRLASDRADLDYIRVFVGKANVVGVPLARLPMPAGYPTHLLHVRRYDADLVPTPDLMLEFGDRVGVLTPPDRKEEIRRHFGDTVKAAAEFSYVSLGIGMVLGVLLGLIPIPIPGVGVVTLGIGGGPLIVALILGKLRRTGPMLWTMPLPANIVLRNFGLAMFLATVGVNAGQPFVRTVAESGLTMLFIGAAVLLTTVVIVLLVGHYLMKIPYDDLVGVASGATGNPAILVYSTKMAPTERPDIGYAMIFPSMTLVKVIAAQIVGLLALGGAPAG